MALALAETRPLAEACPSNASLSLSDAGEDDLDAQAGLADLPAELLTAVVAAAHLALRPAGATHTGALPCRHQLPSLTQVAQLCGALEACCRSWRAAAAEGLPVHVAIGSSPLPADAARLLSRWVRRHPLAALHFEATTRLPGCRPGEVRLLAVDLMASEELVQASGAALEELAVWDFVCSRPLCALLPRFPALRSLALAGYNIDLDLQPLGQLPRLEALHLEAEALPGLAGLPPSLRHLSLACFANAARVSLPKGLLLDSLVCRCPLQPVYVGLARALEQCRSIHIIGRAIRLLLHVDASAGPEDEAAGAVVSAFCCGHARVQRLLLETPAGRLAVKQGLSAAAAALRAPAVHRLTHLDPQAVCAHVATAAAAGRVSASIIPSHVDFSGGLELPAPPEGLLLLKTPCASAS